MGETLIVNEIFRTLQGEGTRAGRACTIVRLTGCNLRCSWCDTRYAYEQGREMTVAQVVGRVRRLGCGLVLVTGGEPLLQQAAPALLKRLCDEGYEVLLETNGSRDISDVDGRVVRCVDVKCPGSGQADSFLPANLHHLRRRDEVKFILADERDYLYAREVIRRHGLSARCQVILTPAAGLLEPAALAGWILRDCADLGPVRLGLQVHKLVWPGVRRGV